MEDPPCRFPATKLRLRYATFPQPSAQVRPPMATGAPRRTWFSGASCGRSLWRDLRPAAIHNHLACSRCARHDRKFLDRWKSDPAGKWIAVRCNTACRLLFRHGGVCSTRAADKRTNQPFFPILVALFYSLIGIWTRGAAWSSRCRRRRADHRRLFLVPANFPLVDGPPSAAAR